MGKDGNYCPAFCPAACRSDEMMCPGGEDWNGCNRPETCYPAKGINFCYLHSFHNFELFVGPMGKDGMECTAYCPANCDDAEQMMCPGGEDHNGCMRPETCMPSRGSILILVVLF